MPDWKPEIRQRLAQLRIDPTRETAIVEELANDLDDCYAELLARGVNVAEAYRQTLAELDGRELLARELMHIERKSHREPLVLGTNRRTNMIADLWQDVHFGVRMLAKQPVFTLIAVLSLALGIGANTAIFSLVDALLLKSLPVREAAALVQFKWASGDSFRVRYDGYSDRTELPGLRVSTSFTHPTFVQLQAQQQTLTDVFAFATVEQLNVNLSGQAEIAKGLVVSGNYYSALGVTPWRGRLLTTTDDQADAPAVAVLSAQYWERRFGGDPAVIGKQININNGAFTIAGVTPAAFHGTLGNAQAPDVTIALAQEPLVRADSSSLRAPNLWWLMMMGRLKPGVTREQVQAELAALFQQRALTERNAAPPPANLAAAEMPRLLIAPGRQGDTNWNRYYSKSLYLLSVVGGLVLLLACVNVATLLLARATGRQKEIAVRLALGAGRGRLLRQLLAESALLALAGGAFGILLALWGRDLLLRLQFSGQELTGLQAGLMGLDWRLLGFTLAVSILTGLLFGLAPALKIGQATQANLTPILKDASRGSSASARSRLSRTLIVAQVALSLLLLVGAGLFIRTLRNLQQVDIGFTAQNLLLFRIDPRLSGYQGEQTNALYQRLFARLENVPGVQAVTFARHPLLAGSRGSRPIFVAGQNAAASNPIGAHVHIVRANFLDTMNMPVLQGRNLREQDNAQGPSVVVINQTLARRLFSNQNPLGQRFGFSAEKASQLEVVGITQDAKYDSLRDEAPPTVYVPWLQEARVGQMNLTIRTAGDPALLLPAIRQAVREVDGNLPLFDVKTQAEQATQAQAQERLFASLLSFFGLLALLLAAIGLYGVMAQAVTQRTQEIGIRVALGAQSRDVLRLIIGQGMRLVVPGVVLGLISAFAATRLLTSFLYGVRATDWLTYSVIAALLLAVGWLACWLPARRAAQLDPLIALRSE